MRSVMTKEVLQFNKTTPTPTSLYFSSIPIKTSYTLGQTLDLTGLKVSAHYSNGKVEDVTSNITTTPSDGTILSQVGTKDIVISYTENNTTLTIYFTIRVEIKIVSWTDGTDTEIVAMVNAADNGLIDLSQYWAVGNERKVTLNAINGSDAFSSITEQTVTLVLMNKGGKTLINPTPSGRKECSFIVGQKSITTFGQMGGYGWKNCSRRRWCNNTFRSSIPASLRSIFKEHINVNASNNTADYFAIPHICEINIDYRNWDTKLHMFEWYESSVVNRYVLDESNRAEQYWTRFSYNDDNRFYYVYPQSESNRSGMYWDTYLFNGEASSTTSYGFVVFGVI